MKSRGESPRGIDLISSAAAISAALLELRRRRAPGVAEYSASVQGWVRRAAAGRPIHDDRALAVRQRRHRAGAHARLPGRRATAARLVAGPASVHLPALPAPGRAAGRRRWCGPTRSTRSSRRCRSPGSRRPRSRARLGIPVIWRAGGTEIRPFEQAMLAAWATLQPARPAGLLRRRPSTITSRSWCRRRRSSSTTASTPRPFIPARAIASAIGPRARSWWSASRRASARRSAPKTSCAWRPRSRPGTPT